MQSLAAWLGIEVGTLERVVWTLVVLVAYLLLRTVLRRVIRGGIQGRERRYAATKVVNTTLGVLVLVAITLVWTRGGTGVAAYLGIVSAGIAIALQDPLTNLAGFLFIAVRKPFSVGDRIEIGEHRGDVVDVRMFQFSIIEIGNWVDADQSTGRLIHVPNGLVFKQPTANYTQGFDFIWDELPVTVTFESDWRRAKDILQGLVADLELLAREQAAAQVERAAGKFLVHYEHLTPIVWTAVADHGVTLTARYLCQPRRRRSVSSELWEAVLDAFAVADDIDFAYPTTRFYDNRAEGKSGAAGRLDRDGDGGAD